MAIGTQRPAEPIPGYRLLERLGSGGFGEVWKCEAPGGLLKAIKIVHGDLAAGAAEPQLAAQELKALRRVQAVRHPHLLAIERYDIVDGRLLIVSELADGSLWDRFRDCRQQNRPGIPREDVLRYLRETADVLDLMNQEHDLQHLDIKPQNLFLADDHVKVGDFGLVTDLKGMQCVSSGGATPAYAAPETFDGALSRHCDQYSLAVVYQELLTGQRPFSGGSVQQVILQHLRSAPNLSALPPGDRAAVGRALSKRPEDRFPSCAAFVQTLHDGSAVTVDLGSGSRPAADSGSSSSLWLAAVSDTHTLPAADTVVVSVRPERIGDGVLTPALVIGLGGTGRAVLQQLRRTLTDQFGPPERLPHLRLLYVDTDTDAIRAALEGATGSALAPDEVLPARLQRTGHYAKPRSDGRPLTAKWCDQRWLDRLGQTEATQGVRALGRLAFADHYRALSQKVESALAAATRPDALERADQHTGLGLRSDRPRVYVVAGLAGGTGGGMAFDVAYLARYLLRRFGYDPEGVAGWFLVPSVGGDVPANANAYAALTELAYYSRSDTSYRARCDEPDGALSTRAAPFGRLVLLPLDTPELAANGLAHEIMTPLGRALDATRADADPSARVETPILAGVFSTSVSTFGAVRFAWPRRTILERASRRLSRRRLERWINADAAKVRSAVQTWVTEQWESLELGPEPLTRRFQQVCVAELEGSVEKSFAALTDTPTNGDDVLVGVEELFGRLAGLLTQATEELVPEWGGRLARLAACLIEQPDFRLAGAETAIRLLRENVERALKHFSPLAEVWLRKGEQAHGRIQEMLASNAPAAGELLDTLRLYPRCRFQALLFRQVAAVYTALQSQLADQSHEVALCRMQLAKVIAALQTNQSPPDPPGLLLPAGCETIDDAATQLLSTLTRDDLRDFDRRAQQAVQQTAGGLICACLTDADPTPTLGPLLTEVSRDVLAARLGDTGPADLFLARRLDPAAAWDAAAPALASATAEFATLVTPPETAAGVFCSLARQTMPAAEVVAAPGLTDIAFYRAITQMSLEDLPQLGAQARVAYKRFRQTEGFSPHARADVDWSHGPSRPEFTLARGGRGLSEPRTQRTK